MSAGKILETLLKTERHVQSLGGRFFARVIIHTHEIVSVNMDFEQIPKMRVGGYGVSRHKGELDKLKEELEWVLDHVFGPEWREAEGWGNASEIISTLLKAQKHVEDRIGAMRAVITISRQSVDIQVEATMKRGRRLKTQRFGVSRILIGLNDFEKLQKGLELMLDVHLGTGWREAE